MSATEHIDKKLLLNDFIREPNRKGVWNFYNPKNLYMTDLQGKLYLKLMGDDRYSSKFHDSTEALIQRNADKITGRFKPESVLIVDLGPGYPSKTFPLIDTFLKSHRKVTYWAVDVNEHFGNLARDAISERGVSESYAKKMLFEDTASAIRQSKVKGPKLVIIGLTFMNFKADYILNILSDCIDSDEDACLSAIECSDGVDTQRLTDGYCNDDARIFVFMPLSILGCNEADVKYDVSFHDGRVEMAFIMVNVPEVLKAHGVVKGDRVITAISYRYTAAQYESLLHSNFGKNLIDRSGNVVLALSQR